MPKFFYGKDHMGMPYGSLSEAGEGISPLESTVTSWVLMHRARYDQWPAHVAVREHLDDREQRALYQVIRRGWVELACTDDIARYTIPTAKHTNGRRRRMAGSTWDKIADALAPAPPRYLSPPARRLLIYLIDNRDETGGICKSRRAIATEARMSTVTLGKCLKELRAWGMITTERIGGRHSRHTLAEDRLKEYTGVKA